LKVSEDGLVQGITTLALIEGKWYYKTEIMNEADREFVIPVVGSLNKKINMLMKN
jgi:hypothetical protein